ncbi:MAG: hypothetical protein V8S32_01895 [Lachnospiraceae bacterium]
MEKLSLTKAAQEKEEAFQEYAGFAVYTIFSRTAAPSGKIIQETEMENLFREIEMPLTKVLHEMEKEGVEVRPEELKAFRGCAGNRINELENSIHKQAGKI